MAPGATGVAVDDEFAVLVTGALVVDVLVLVLVPLDEPEVTGVLVVIVKPLVVTVGTVTATVTGTAFTTCTFGVTTAAINAPA